MHTLLCMHVIQLVNQIVFEHKSSTGNILCFILLASSNEKVPLVRNGLSSFCSPFALLHAFDAIFFIWIGPPWWLCDTLQVILIVTKPMKTFNQTGLECKRDIVTVPLHLQQLHIGEEVHHTVHCCSFHIVFVKFPSTVLRLNGYGPKEHESSSRRSTSMLLASFSPLRKFFVFRACSIDLSMLQWPILI